MMINNNPTRIRQFILIENLYNKEIDYLLTNLYISSNEHKKYLEIIKEFHYILEETKNNLEERK